MKDIENVKKAKAEIKVYEKFQVDVDKLRAQQDALRANMVLQNTSIIELKDAVQTLSLSTRLNIPPSSISRVTLVIPDEFVGNLIGKSGGSVSAIITICLS